MDTAIVSGAGTLQLIGLAFLLVMLLVFALRILGQGPKGFSSLIGEVGAFLVAGFILIRPNDAALMLTHIVGGVQTPTAIH